MPSSLRDSLLEVKTIPEAPEPWVCGKCGYVRDPYWSRWKKVWLIYDGPCEGCESLKLGQQALMDQKRAVMRNCGLTEGEYGHMRLETFEPNPVYKKNQTAVKNAVLAMVDAWKGGDWSRGIMIYSTDVGIGKTHLVIGAARIGIQLYTPPKLGGKIFTIWDMPGYVRAIKDSYDSGQTEMVQRSAADPAILIMDDLGAEYVKTADWYQGLMYDIVNSRWKDQKATLVTTNLTLEQLQEKIGIRAVSRLSALTGPPVKMRGNDYRIRGRQ